MHHRSHDSGGLYPGGSLSRGEGLCPQGVSVRETPGQRLHSYGNERAVRILLECILVICIHCAVCLFLCIR